MLVGFNTCLVWKLLVLPSDACAAPNLPSLRMPDGDTSKEPRESLSLDVHSQFL